MRFARVLVALACLALGAIVGALNVQPVSIDFGAATASTTLGVAIILALLVGVAVGGLAVTASLVLPLRRRLSHAQGSRAAGEPGA